MNFLTSCVTFPLHLKPIFDLFIKRTFFINVNENEELLNKQKYRKKGKVRSSVTFPKWKLPIFQCLFVKTCECVYEVAVSGTISRLAGFRWTTWAHCTRTAVPIDTHSLCIPRTNLENTNVKLFSRKGFKGLNLAEFQGFWWITWSQCTRTAVSIDAYSLCSVGNKS